MKKLRKKIFSRTSFIVLLVFFIMIFYFVSSEPVYKPQTQFLENVKGFSNASVSVVVYGDYQCLRTKNFWNEIVPRLEEDYIKTGKVKLTFKQYPKLFYNYSLQAAEASECAADQGKFWEYSELLFQKTTTLCVKSGIGLGLNPADLKKYAKELGLDTTLFNKCLDSGTMLPRIQADIDELHKRGMRAAGVVYINREMISGNRPYEEFQSIIEKVLNQTIINQ